VKRRITSIFVLLFFCQAGSAQEILTREGQDKIPDDVLVVPFAFYNTALGLAVGGSVGRRGWLQPQSTIFATVIGSVEGTLYGFLAVRDVEVPLTDRLFIDAQLNLGTFSEMDIFSDGNPTFPNERAGSHGSDKDNFITGDGNDNAGWVQLLYVLPIGEGKENPKSHLALRDGMVVEGARDTSTWNPFKGGYTVAGLKPFFRRQDVNFDTGDDQESNTAGAEFILHYHNTDFSENPSRGGLLQLRYTRDWGELESTSEWETLDFMATRYFPLASGERSRQRVLALTAWWIDTPSWNDYEMDNGNRRFHRPPPYAGASLGGLNRMKGYPEGRFHDRSAVYYSMEYRHMINWNPLKDMKWLTDRHAYVDWLQVVAGVEAGRVNDTFDLGDLHSDMNVGGLFGIRMMGNHVVLRADLGISKEGAAVQMSIDHPF
jgi:hypothetical protein